MTGILEYYQTFNLSTIFQVYFHLRGGQQKLPSIRLLGPRTMTSDYFFIPLIYLTAKTAPQLDILILLFC